MILTRFYNFLKEMYCWMSKCMEMFCQNPGKAFISCWLQESLAVLLLPLASIARCTPAISLYLHMQPHFIYWKEVAVFIWVLSNTCLFWISIHFTFSFTIFFKNMQLKNFLPFFEGSFWVMSQPDLAILTSALRFFTYNTQLSSPITKYFCFLEALSLTTQAQYQ